MERREFISLITLVGLTPAIGPNNVPYRPYIHECDESRKVTPIREVGFGDKILRLDIDPYIESSIVWSMTKNSEPIHTQVRSTDISFADGLVQYHFERQLKDGKSICLISHKGDSTTYTSTTKNGTGDIISIRDPDFSEYAQRFYESFSQSPFG